MHLNAQNLVNGQTENPLVAMRRSLIISGIFAGVAGGVAYYLTTRQGAEFRSGVQQRARVSAAWLQGQQREMAQGLHRIEAQIMQLGEEMRHRLDTIAEQAAGAVQPRIEEDWGLDKGDLQQDLRGLPGQR